MPTPPEPTPPPAPGNPRPRKSIMRSLGEFVGHIAHAVRTPAAGSAPAPAPPRHVTGHHVEEEQRDTPLGRVTVRRTVIEEVELPPPNSPPEPTPQGRPDQDR